MAKTVMQRVFALIDEQDSDIQAFLKEVLKIERAHLANADTGIKERLHNELSKFLAADGVVVDDH